MRSGTTGSRSRRRQRWIRDGYFHAVRCSEASARPASPRCSAAQHARAQRRHRRPASLVVHVPEGMWSGASGRVAGGTDLGPIFEALQPYQSRHQRLNNLNMESRRQGSGRRRPPPRCAAHAHGHRDGGREQRRRRLDRPEDRPGDRRLEPFASLQLAVRIVYGDTNSTADLVGPQPRGQPDAEPVRGVHAHLQGRDAQRPTTPTTPPPTAPVVNLKRSALDHSLAEIVEPARRASAPAIASGSTPTRSRCATSRSASPRWRSLAAAAPPPRCRARHRRRAARST